MTEQEIKTAVSVFQAARVGHNKYHRSKATKRLVKAVADYLNADGGTNDQARLDVAVLLNGQGK